LNTSVANNLNIESNLKGFLPQNSVVIFNNHSQKKIIKDFKVFSIYEFCEYILRKSPLLFYPQTLSDTAGIFIINALTKDILKKNTALFNLTKSTAFSNELYVLFGRFLALEITPAVLKNTFSELTVSDEDQMRFELIIETYEQYLSKLNEIEHIDRRSLCSFTREILERFPKYREKITNDFANIIIDKKDEPKESELMLFKTINAVIFEVEFDKVTHNHIAESIAKKYLPEKTFNFNEKVSQNRLAEFRDLREEALFIAQDIINKVQKNGLKFEDFTVVLNGKSLEKTFCEVFREANIPANFDEVDINYQNFIIKLTQYLNICSGLCELLKTPLLKADTERIYDEINLNFENIISQTLENQFTKDKFLEIQQSTNEPSLIKCLEKNLNILNAGEIKKLQSELKKLKTLSTLFNENRITDFITYAAKSVQEKSTEFQKKLAVLIKKINNLEKLSFTLKKNTLNVNEILEIINTKISDKNFDSNGVNITNLKSPSINVCKEVYLPGLTEKSIPDKNCSIQFLSENAANEITTAIRKKSKNFENIILNNFDLINESAKNLVRAMFYATDTVTLSTHKYEDKKQLTPSMFFQYAKTEFPQFVIEPDFKNSATENHQQISLNLSSLQNEVVIYDNDVIKLNQSAVSAFQSCPRKYYFQHLLGLKETGTFAANYGTIVHAIMENFNRKYLDSYSKETLLALTEKLFNAANAPENALSAGFSRKDVDIISASDLLSLEEMKAQFKSAIDELDKNKFFELIPEKIISEKSFSFSIPQIPNVVFDGRIDAIYKVKGQYYVVDFKTGKTKPELDYMISENGVTFKTKTGKPTNIENKQNEYEYQIPIYYLACQNAPELAELRDKISHLGLLYIRPQNKEEGFKKDFITSEVLNEYLPQIIQNLNDTIVAKIRNREYFSPKYDSIICQNCAFKYLCGTSDHMEEEND